jgi:antitoxin component of MazEF toxin-antitoxin module
MEAKTRRADKKGRVSLFSDFADRLVIVKRISDDEVRVIKAKAVRKRYSLKELVDQITPESLHDEVDTGPSVGAEEW